MGCFDKRKIIVFESLKWRRYVNSLTCHALCIRLPRLAHMTIQLFFLKHNRHNIFSGWLTGSLSLCSLFFVSQQSILDLIHLVDYMPIINFRLSTGAANNGFFPAKNIRGSLM